MLTRQFMRGVLVLLPILVTIWVVWVLAERISPALAWIGEKVGGELPAPLRIALGLAVSLAVITLVGMAASNWLGRRFLGLLETSIERLPVLKLLYGSIRDLLGAFVGDKRSFDRPVLVALTADGATRVAGFVTRDDLELLGLEGHVAVYLPQSFNFAGNLILVPTERVRAIDAHSPDVMAFLVSGGVSAERRR